jgi:hypothetical protein
MVWCWMMEVGKAGSLVSQSAFDSGRQSDLSSEQTLICRIRTGVNTSTSPHPVGCCENIRDIVNAACEISVAKKRNGLCCVTSRFALNYRIFPEFQQQRNKEVKTDPQSSPVCNTGYMSQFKFDKDHN